MYCPVCKKPVKWEDNRFRPFCGERCKLVDLGAWADEAYSISGGADNDKQQPSEVNADTEKEGDE